MTKEQHNAQMRTGLEFFLKFPIIVQAILVLIVGGGVTGGAFTVGGALTFGERIATLEAAQQEHSSELRSLALEVSRTRAETRIQSDYLACLNDPGITENVRTFCRRIRDQVHQNLDLLTGSQ